MSRIRILLLLAVLGAPVAADAAESSRFEMVPAANGFFRPTDSYRIAIPPGTPVETLQRLALELDGIDVTAFVGSDGREAVFTPPQPLAYGPHLLRIVENLPDGGMRLVGEWTFEVRRSTDFREFAVAAGLDYSAARRAADRNLTPRPPETVRDGSLRVEAVAADADWKVAGRVDVAHSSQLRNMPADRHTDLIGGYVEAGKGDLVARGGDHAPIGDSLLARDFTRRGVSGSVRLEPLRSEVTAFALRSEPIRGVRHGFGVNDPDNLTDGIALRVRPLSADDDRLQVHALHLRSSGRIAGSAVLGETTPIDGEASALAVDGLAISRRLHARVEFATSDTDFDGPLGPLTATSDKAWVARLRYEGEPREWMGAAGGWETGYEHGVVGPAFFSLANPALMADRQSDRVFFGLRWRDWSARTQIGREHDNVDDDPRLPRTRADNLLVGLRYAPDFSREGAWSVFSRPVVDFSAESTGQRFDRVPAGYGAGGLDREVRTVHAGVAFASGQWSWSLRRSISRFEDRINSVNDYDDERSELAADLRFGESLSLRPRVQHNRTEQPAFDLLTRVWLAEVGAFAVLLPGRVDASLDFGHSRERRSDLSVDFSRSTASASLSWHVISASADHPGASLFVGGSHFTDHRQTGSAASAYQAFAGLRIGWPVRY